MHIEYTLSYFYWMIALIPLFIAYIIDYQKGLSTYIYSYVLTIILAVVAILFFGNRPLDFGLDTIAYVDSFNREKFAIESKEPFESSKDFGYDLFNRLSAHIFTDQSYLLFCACILVLFFLIGYSRIFKEKTAFPFFMLCSCFFFWAFGTNVIRAGLGMSTFILGMSFSKNRIVQITIVIIAYLFHLSVLLCVVAWFLPKFIKPIKFYLIIWGGCFVLAILNIDMVSDFISNFEEDSTFHRTAAYASGESEYQTGFRPDFVLFSFFFLVIGVYMLKKIYSDEFYDLIIKMYIFLNACFLLSMNLAYSDRFAGLSWAFIPIVACYPLVKTKNKNNNYIMFGFVIMMIALSLYLFKP